MWHDLSICVTWHSDMTRQYMYHGIPTWPVQMRTVTSQYVLDDVSIYVTWLVHICTMCQYLQHDIQTWLVNTCDMTFQHDHTHTHTPTHTHTGWVVNMGWLRSVGSLKLHVSFAKEPYQRDDLFHKRPIILRSLLIVAIPYV